MKLTRKIKKVQDELKAQVAREYRHPIEISVREEPGPLGLKVIVACNPKAHPGSGMKRVLMDDQGVTYGVHGEKELAELCRQKGWLANPPDPAAFLRLVNLACYDGIAMLLAGEGFRPTKQGMAFRFIRVEHPSGKKVGVGFGF